MSSIGSYKPIVIGGLAVCAATGLILYKIWTKKKTKEFELVGKLDQIVIYPVKSCRGMTISQADCLKQSLKYKSLMDRHWMILDGEDRFMTIRHDPRMVLISTSVTSDGKYLLLDAPDMTTLQVPVDVRELPRSEQKTMDVRVFGRPMQGNYCGKEAEEWLSSFLKTDGCKLVHLSSDLNLIDTSQTKRARQIGKKGDVIGYQDEAAFMLLGKSSVEDLNEKLEKSVSIKNFRPNFIVTGSQPYAEDDWKYIKIGNIILRHMKCDDRCTVTTVDPETGVRSESNEPLMTLKKYRMCKAEDKPLYKESPLFGVHLALDTEGSVKIGDSVYACFE
ncbi:mitochondrial amidoxime-reducing component 1-like [Glandiceps talaboti]